MIGITYLCDINNMSYADLARELGISRQTIAAWVSGRRKVSEKHYEKLKEIFKVNEMYFKKQLTELDKLQLQKMKLEYDTLKVNLNAGVILSERNQELQNILHKVNYKINSNEMVQKEDIKSVINDLLNLI
ncbi:MAG: helix-turn-helix domain-containing protein [Clostridium chrysemydis]|uniref:helix-turn-helix domain-containing protein n=1 Tax=Clostridium chrysemydis TaxID=2665504 RepID=UPI003F2DB1C4